MKIAYLCSREITDALGGPDLDDSPATRSYLQLRDAIAERHGEIDAVAWDDADADWADYDAALLGATWDYVPRRDEFVSTLCEIEDRVRLFNSAKTVEWNSRKVYLRELSERDVEAVSTVWMADATPAAIDAAFDLLGITDMVVKPQVGASAVNQHRLRRGDTYPTYLVPMMAQPFVPTVTSEGEFSFIFVDGDFSHAVLKRPAENNYLVQPQHGGISSTIDPTKEDLHRAMNAIDALDEQPLYARVDMVRNPATGQLHLMELELIEPYLFPEFAPDLSKKLVGALIKRLAA